MKARSCPFVRLGRQFITSLCFPVLGLYVLAGLTQAQGVPTTTPTPAQELTEKLTPFLEVLNGKTPAFQLEADLKLPINSKVEEARLKLARWDDQTFQLQAANPEYAVEIERTESSTAMILPKHRIVYVGKGESDPVDHLACQGITERIVSSGCDIQPYFSLLAESNPTQLAALLSALVEVRKSEDSNTYQVGDDVRISFSPQGDSQKMEAVGKDWKLSFVLSKAPQRPPLDHTESAWGDYQVQPLQRAELERHLARGARRALEIVLPSSQLKMPTAIPKRVAGGELRYVQGQRLVILRGTPEEIGTAHGLLLKTQAQRCIDSVLYAFGTAQTIATGRWFRADLEAAYARLKPHIPAAHIAETRALANAMGQDPDVLETLNVFPELFHCSGFAVSGSATTDGKLYHGRVLDYMTTIGLQDCATTFIIHVDGKIPFANIGYAGFTGSVSGMNAEGISLGEMGGRGEGQWDGVPMATLMRRALEECGSMDQVVKLWTTSPRTCEYYYVFADGKTNEALGVAATPQSIQFVAPGEGHELLGEGIADSIVLSADSRLATLRQRITDNHGKIDQEKAIWLMSRPVAMRSNLHNVLFVPEDGVFFVANASHSAPAADGVYVRYDLQALLQAK